jgi:glyoxylase-like metal-dependent hydrolase (beta-lactamase superfamily II)
MGAMEPLLAAAPQASPVCGSVGVMLWGLDWAARPPVALGDGQALRLGRHVVRWLDAPHVPHGWDCGFLIEDTTRTLLCGDLFSQSGADHAPLTESDILGPSEADRAHMEYFSRGPDTQPGLEKLAATNPRVLACMHGPAWHGDGSALLRELARQLRTSG